MSEHKKTWWKCALARFFWTFLQALVGTIPAGFTITPAMIQYFQIDYVYVILAWIGTALLTAFVSLVTCHFRNLPEVDLLMQDIEEGEECEE